MRLALLGDIHGNAAALEAVLSAAAAADAEHLCITGDFTGYYYEPLRVLQLLEGWSFDAVRGNHDDFFLACCKNSEIISEYRMKYGTSIDSSLDVLDQNDRSFLRQLPRDTTLNLDGTPILLAHGAPWDTDTYVYPDADESVWEQIAGYGASLVVLGHTHYQFDRRLHGSLVINPGSVGQPRDRRPGAAWTLFDTQTGQFEHRRETYDVDTLVREAQLRDPQIPFLASVLTRI